MAFVIGGGIILLSVFSINMKSIMAVIVIIVIAFFVYNIVVSLYSLFISDPIGAISVLSLLGLLIALGYYLGLFEYMSNLLSDIFDWRWHFGKR